MVAPGRSPADELRAACGRWTHLADHLKQAAQAHHGIPAAIYGAGFYGSVIRALPSENTDVRCFLDRNPHAHGASHMGPVVLGPEAVPADIGVVYAGVNPLKARAIIASVPQLAGRTIV